MTSSKNIMIISDRRDKAKRLKEEIEKRQDVCDRVDIYSANPNKLLEELVINKGKEQYDYRMFIIEESADPDFLLSKHLEHNFPTAHLVLWVKDFERPKTPDQIRSNLFISRYKKGMTLQQCLEAYKKYYRISDEEWNKTFESDKKSYQREMSECERAINFECYFYGTNYIIEPYRGDMNYGRMIGKLKHIMVTGIYDGRAPKVYPSPQEERKAKSEKAYKSVMAGHGGFVTTSRSTGRHVFTPATPPTDEEVFRQYKWLGKDITEYEHISDIMKRLRSLRNQKRQELEDVDKTIRDLEDKLPRLVEDPSAFEVVGEEKKKEEK